MTDETPLATRPDVELEAYGEIDKVREMTRRLMAMLPSAKDLGPAGAGALAQASLAMGLNPFIGQVWAIPQRGGTYGIMVGISGLRAKAHEQAKADHGMYSVTYRQVREDEIEGLQINKGDIVRACDLTVSGDRARRHLEMTREVPRYTGIGVYRSGESTKMNPLQVARKRAEAEAIKQAFDVPLSFVYGGASQDVVFEPDEVAERYTESGDGLVNGNAYTAARDLFEDLDPEPHAGSLLNEDELTGDPFLNGDRHGAPPDADSYAEYKEIQEDEAQTDIGLDYVPDWIDTSEKGRFADLAQEALAQLGYTHRNHVENAIKQVVPDRDERAKLTYRQTWILLQEHQRSKAPRVDEPWEHPSGRE